MRAARLGAVLLAAALAACAQAAVATHPKTTAVSTPPLTEAPVDALPNGLYVDRILVPACYQSSPPIHCPDYDGPHYIVTLTMTGQQAFRGAVSWVAQDGNTFPAFTFTGTSQSGTAVLTVQSVGAPEPKAAPQPVRPGSLVSAHFARVNGSLPSNFDGSRTLILDGCISYLSLIASRDGCEFFYSPSGYVGS
jgi:hypothetical protein